MDIRQVSFASGERLLAGTLVSPDEPSGAAVLFVHGLGSARSTNIERAQAVAEQNSATCLAVDLGGHGDSTGRLTQMTPRMNAADVVAGYDQLATVAGVDPARIGVCAASYGAYLSVLLSAHRPVARLLLRAPALYADDRFDVALGQRRFGDAASAPTPLAHLAHFAGPVTLVESEHDEVIDHGIVEAYLASRPGIVHIVQPDAPHALRDPAQRAAYRQIVVGFFTDL